MTYIGVEHFYQFDEDSPMELGAYALAFTDEDDDSELVFGAIAAAIMDASDAGYSMDEISGAAFVGRVITRAVNAGLTVMPIPLMIEAIEHDDLLTLICYDSGGVSISYGSDDCFFDPSVFCLRFGCPW